MTVSHPAEAASCCLPAQQAVNCLTGFLKSDRQKFCQITFQRSHPMGPLLSLLFQWAHCLIGRIETSRSCPTWHVKPCILQLHHPLIFLRNRSCRQLACRSPVPATTRQPWSAWRCAMRAPGGVNKLSVDSSCGVNNTVLCSRCSEHSHASPLSLQGATTPSVPRLPAPVRVTSPPVPARCPSIAWWRFTGDQTTGHSGRMLGLDCRTGAPTFYYNLNHTTRFRQLMPLSQRLCS